MMPSFSTARWVPALRLVSLLFLAMQAGWADLKGSGNIGFDAEGDGAVEGLLNTSGLGIGTVSPGANLHVLGNAAVSVNVGIGTSAPASSLDVMSTWGLPPQTVSANTTLSGNSVIIANASSNITLTLPYAGNCEGRMYLVKKAPSSYDLHVEGGGNLIDNLETALITSASSNNGLSLISNGRQWLAIGGATTASTFGMNGNLVGYWKFEESSGNTAADSSRYGNSGTLGGGMSFSSNSLTGKVGKALSFSDGGNDHVNLDNIPIVSATGAKMTVVFWMKWDGVSGGMPFGWNIYDLWFNGTTFGFNTGSSDVTGISSNAMGGVWVHVAAVFVHNVAPTTTNVELYINGVKQTLTLYSGTVNIRPITSIARISGWRGDDTLAYRIGTYMDEVRIYDRALSADEIRTLYDATK